MAKTLNERIASARSTDRVTITDLENLIADARAEHVRVGALLSQATADSIRFELSDEDRDEAAVVAERAKRNSLALSGAIEDLSAKLAEKRTSDEQRARKAERAAALRQRDALAERLRLEWPAIEAQVLELLQSIKDNEAELARLRLSEANADAVARGLPGNFMDANGAYRRLTDLKMPSFTQARHLAWPSHKPINLDAAREEMLEARERMFAEEGRWKRYVVTPPAGNTQMIPLSMRNGPGAVRDLPIIGRMTDEGANDARAKGCAVEIATASMTIGLPSARPLV